MKNKFMMIRATEEEKNLAQLKAQEMGMGLSAFVRLLVKNHNTTERPSIQRESLLERIVEVFYALGLKRRS